MASIIPPPTSTSGVLRYFTSLLHDARGNEHYFTQAIIDEAYDQLKFRILGPSTPHTKPTSRPRKLTHRPKKGKMKRYRYARTQRLYREDPSTLARYIREGVAWLEECPAHAPPDDVKPLYTSLWDVSPGITLPFQQPTPDTIERAEETLVPNSAMDINDRLRRLKKKTAPGPDGITTSLLQQKEVKEALPYFL
jgi:hypothetical protein